jgi:hypothetical protein
LELLRLPGGENFANELLWFAEKGKDYPVKVTGVEIVPDPVQPGSPATFKISATTGKLFSGRNFFMRSLFPR